MNETLRLRGGKLEWREIEGEVVALDGATAEYLGVNRSGGALWPLLAEGATREVLVARLVERFDIDPERAGHDVDGFLGTLRERGLLEA